MKRQLLCALSLLGVAYSQAQQTLPYTQDFENTQQLTDQDWLFMDFDGEGGTFTPIPSQTILTQLGFTGKIIGSANFIDLDGDGQNQQLLENSDNAVASSAITIPAGASAAFSIRIAGIGQTSDASSHYSIYMLNEEELEAAITSEATVLEDFLTFLNTQTPISVQDTNGPSDILNYDISQYGGQVIRILIRHHQSEGFTYLFLDDFKVTGSTLGIGQEVATQFTIYPNPAVDLITIAKADNSVTESVTVTDVNGRVILEKKVNNQQEIQIRAADWQSGVYWLKVTTDQGSTTKKIIKK